MVFLVLTTNIITAQSKVFDNLKMESKILKMERKFAVYPSAYANGWLVRTYKAKGGKYRME